MGDGKARQVEVPEEARSIDTLAHPSYAYACEISASPLDERTAEAWLRAMFEESPASLRRFVVAGWILVLRLRLGPRRSPDHVLGWKVLSTTPDVAVIGVQGATLSAHHVMRIDGTTVVHVTFVRYDRPAGRILWAASAPIHVRVIPFLMNHAARRVPKSPYQA